MHQWPASLMHRQPSMPSKQHDSHGHAPAASGLRASSYASPLAVSWLAERPSWRWDALITDSSLLYHRSMEPCPYSPCMRLKRARTLIRALSKQHVLMKGCPRARIAAMKRNEAKLHSI